MVTLISRFVFSPLSLIFGGRLVRVLLHFFSPLPLKPQLGRDPCRPEPVRISRRSTDTVHRHALLKFENASLSLRLKLESPLSRLLFNVAKSAPMATRWGVSRPRPAPRKTGRVVDIGSRLALVSGFCLASPGALSGQLFTSRNQVSQNLACLPEHHGDVLFLPSC